jgi:hypothetical protein
MARFPWYSAALLLPSLLTPACSDKVKLSEEKAVGHATELGQLVERDIEEIRKGLPAGGKKLAEVLNDGEAGVTPGKARKAMKKTREAVTDLQLAKSTFFALTDLDGNAYASDQETDGISGKNLFPLFPGLDKGKAGYTELLGSWAELNGVKTGLDQQWVAAAPVAGADGVAKGLYVTGWSFRKFAYHLEQQLKANLRQEAQKTGNNREPLVYVFVVQGAKAFGTPVVPEVNQKAIEGLQVAEKLKNAETWRGPLEITDRTYGAAARQTKKLCPDCAIVVLRSEI